MIKIKKNFEKIAVLLMLFAVSVPSFAYEAGDVIKFGRYSFDDPYETDDPEQPIKWIILEQYNDGTALIISKYAIDAQPYNAEYKKTNWEKSTLRKWLNTNFLSKAFTDVEQQNIITSFVDNKIKDRKWKTSGGKNTYDKIYLLSYWEAEKFFSDNEDRIAEATPFISAKKAYTIGNIKKDKGSYKIYKSSINEAFKLGATDFSTNWWLRTPGESSYTSAARVDFQGTTYSYGQNVSDELYTVRPVMKIKLQGINSSVASDKKHTKTTSTLSENNHYRETADDAVRLAKSIAPQAKRRNPNAIAVIIGAKDYDAGITSVAYAHNDSAAVRDIVIKTLGYSKDNIIYEENPTKGKLEQIFGTKDDYKMQLYNWIKPGKSDVFIYYTGHGAPDQKTQAAYFVPKDADPNYVRAGGYAMETLYSNLAKLPARSIIVVTDACFSGQDGSGKMIIKSASPLAVSAKIPVAETGANSKMTIFNASKSNEMASWYDAAQHSLFTYYFLLGISGEADSNNDKTITAGEIDAYLQETVPYRARRLFNREQHPMLIGNSNAAIATYK